MPGPLEGHRDLASLSSGCAPEGVLKCSRRTEAKRSLPLHHQTLFNTVNLVTESSPGQRESIVFILGPWNIIIWTKYADGNAQILNI